MNLFDEFYAKLNDIVNSASKFESINSAKLL